MVCVVWGTMCGVGVHGVGYNECVWCGVVCVVWVCVSVCLSPDFSTASLRETKRTVALPSPW